MQQSPLESNAYMLGQITRQLEKLEERIAKLDESTRETVKRVDLDDLQRRVVARDLLDLQLEPLKTRMIRLDEDRILDRKAIDKRIDDLEAEQISKQDKLWIRIGQVIGIMGFVLVLFELLSRVKLTP